MNQKIYKLLYVSSATHGFQEDDLLDILKIARKNNSQLGITGVLLYSEGNFLQVLEGDKPEVEALYAKIHEDQRHGGVVRLLAEYTETRDFPDWSMGYQRVKKEDVEREIEGFNRLIESEYLSEDEMQQISARTRLFIETFRQTSGLQ